MTRMPLLSIFLILANGSSYALSENQLKEDLIGGRPAEQQRAMVELAARGPVRLMTDIIAGAKDKSAKERAATALEQHLKNSGNRSLENLSALEPLMDSDDPSTVEAAARGIMHYKKNARARAAIKKSIGNAKSDQTKMKLLGGLMVNIDGDKTEANFLRHFLSDKSENVKVIAAGYIGALGRKDGLSICRDALEKSPKDDSVRGLQMIAAIAAGRIGDSSLLPVLRRVAQDDRYGPAQWEAMLAIKEIELANVGGASEKLEYLKTALSEKYYARWSINRLVADRSAESIELLKWAAQEKKLVGAPEARNALSALASEQR